MPGREAAWRPVHLFPPGADAPRHPRARQLRLIDLERERSARQIASIDAATLRTILPVLEQAERETAAGLRAWVRNVPNGALRYTAQQHRNVLLHLRTAFETIATLHPEMARALGSMVRGTGPLAVEHLRHEVARFSGVFGGSEQAIQLNLTRILATSDRYIIPRIRTSAARYAGNVGRDIRRELSVGIVRGESVSAMTSRLQRHGGPRGTVALRGVAGEPGAVTEEIAEGLFARYRYWAERVVRTESISAYNTQKDEAYREALDEIPDLKRMWDATVDGRVCPECAGSHGSIAAVDQAFPNGATAPPLHPNCRCTTVPWRDEWSTLRALGGAA